MDSHSHGNKRLPKGFLVGDEIKEPKARKLIHPHAFVNTASGRIRRTLPSPSGSHIIVRAYNEPLGNDMVEDLVLQRDYIID